MAKSDFKSVDEHVAAHPEAVQAILQLVRRTIRKVVPGADEVISYQMPTYKLHGSPVLYFAGWKRHYSRYPATGGVVAVLKCARVPYELAKGTIRFPLTEAVPMKLIERIAKIRAKETIERARAKRSGAKPRRSLREKPTSRGVKGDPVY